MAFLNGGAQVFRRTIGEFPPTATKHSTHFLVFVLLRDLFRRQKENLMLTTFQLSLCCECVVSTYVSAKADVRCAVSGWRWLRCMQCTYTSLLRTDVFKINDTVAVGTQQCASWQMSKWTMVGTMRDGRERGRETERELQMNKCEHPHTHTIAITTTATTEKV